MGGTSTDVSRYDNEFDYVFEATVGDVGLLTPALAIETVAAGGGSICHFDGQQLKVGPQSAGASPGPACYGAGGPLTLTDANLLLGKQSTAIACYPDFSLLLTRGWPRPFGGSRYDKDTILHISPW
jgi:5-oxoprolinase (ATP-hydrolysing)